jgi:hypothetical protein
MIACADYLTFTKFKLLPLRIPQIINSYAWILATQPKTLAASRKYMYYVYIHMHTYYIAEHIYIYPYIYTYIYILFWPF